MRSGGGTARRRNQPELSGLPLLTRFLSHAIAQKGLTQATVAERLPNCSTSTASRWFRGESHPTDRDLESIADILGIPVQTFHALRVLETLKGGPMLATVAAWRYMADGAGTRLLMHGATMHAGMVQLLDARPVGKLILVSIHDPQSEPSPLVAFDEKMGGVAAGRAQTYWLTTLTTLRSVTRTYKTTHVRLWVRPRDEVSIPGIARPFVGQLAVNDWIAVEMHAVSEGPTPFVVHFFGDSGWNRLVAPLVATMESDEETLSQTLIWDSRWPPGDPRLSRLRERIEAALSGISVESLMR